MTLIARTSSGWKLNLDDTTDTYLIVDPNGDTRLEADYSEILDIGLLFRENVQTAANSVS